ncbi:MAG: sigma-E factor negative regulatory protein [Cellvibrionaceae bacterium]
MEEKQNSSAQEADCEALSALMDNEASEFEIHRALKLLDESPEARVQWMRYQRISESCRGETTATDVDFRIDISSAVRDRLEAEPAYSASRGFKKFFGGRADELVSAPAGGVAVQHSGFDRFFGRAAIAASVAMSVVLGSQFWGVDATKESFQEPAIVDVSAPAGFNIPVSARMASAGDTSFAPAAQANFQSVPAQRVIVVPAGDRVELERRLNWLLLQHAEHAAANGVGMLPYARISKLPAGSVEVSPEVTAED